ncbi:MAG: hypothetical protein IPO09_20490 [Anaeromyxobacter sp.]|nr:hypothetical protein [Anaeromyxobacter sp.]MBL0274830.1 hypothetical protein [Anaeromyxobacter sp.]
MGVREFVEAVVQVLPGARRLLEDHVADNGSLLPHVFMGDVTRLAVTKVKETEHRHEVGVLLSVLERSLEEGDLEVKELVQQSFVENLQGEPAAARAMSSMMGPRLMTVALETLGKL